MHLHNRLTFTGYIRCFCATTSHDHFDLDLWPFDLESASCTALLMSDPHTDFYYPTTIAYWLTSTEYLITFPLLETVTAHAQCHVTPCIGGPTKPHVTIFLTPNCLFTKLYNFYAATMTIKGSLYWSIPMLKRFSVAKKPSQNRSPKWRFFGNLRVQV